MTIRVLITILILAATVAMAADAEPIRTFRVAVTSVEIGPQEVVRPTPAPETIDRCVELIRQAGRKGADLIVLPETPDLVAGTTEPVRPIEKHPAFLAFQAAAREAKIAVVGSLVVEFGGGTTNEAFLLGRDGALIGRYRKMHPAPHETTLAEVAEGEDPFPVFEFESVRIGLAVCMDIHFPEMFRILSLKDADLVCLPTMYLDYTGDMLESIEKARAIDNQLFLALSRYVSTPYLAGRNMGYAKVISPDGRILGSTGHQAGLCIVEFDPKYRMKFWGTQYEDFRQMFNAIRRPDLYAPIAAPREKK